MRTVPSGSGVKVGMKRASSNHDATAWGDVYPHRYGVPRGMGSAHTSQNRWSCWSMGGLPLGAAESDYGCTNALPLVTSPSSVLVYWPLTTILETSVAIASIQLVSKVWVSPPNSPIPAWRLALNSPATVPSGCSARPATATRAAPASPPL